MYCKSFIARRWVLPAVGAILGLGAVSSTHAAIDLDTQDWSVAYLIDNSETVLGVNQATAPRDNRGLALSPDGRYLYAGYNNSVSGGEVRRIDLSLLVKNVSTGRYLATNNYTTATINRLAGPRGKAIATDDQGRVYIADTSTIKVYSADLSTQLGSIPVGNADGISITRSGGVLLAYVTHRGSQDLQAWHLTEVGANVSTGAAPSDAITISGALGSASDYGLRGVEVNPVTGDIWVAYIGNTSGAGEPAGGELFTYKSNGTQLFSPITLDQAFDIGFDTITGHALVTQYHTNEVSILSSSTGSILTTFNQPLSGLGLGLDADGQSAAGALAGIAVIPGVGVYFANESGQTANEQSIYGPTGGDLLHDDNDPILFVHAPEPATLALLTLAAPMLLRRRKHV